MKELKEMTAEELLKLMVLKQKGGRSLAAQVILNELLRRGGGKDFLKTTFNL